MINKIKITVALMSSFFIVIGCSSTNSSRDDYYGYSNHRQTYDVVDNNHSSAVVSDTTNNQQQGTGTKVWKNPLADDYYEDNGDYIAYDRINSVPYYTPVIVPWWAGYYDWYYRPHFYTHFGFYSGSYFGCGWYSPWYDYNPYFGYAWSPNYYNYYPYYSWNYNHHHYGYDNDRGGNVPQKRSVRTFGPSRGTLTTVSSPVYSGTGSSANPRSSSRGTINLTGTNNNSPAKTKLRSNYGSNQSSQPTGTVSTDRNSERLRIVGGNSNSTGTRQRMDSPSNQSTSRSSSGVKGVFSTPRNTGSSSGSYSRPSSGSNSGSSSRSSGTGTSGGGKSSGSSSSSRSSSRSK